jgi:hypothetical protein
MTQLPELLQDNLINLLEIARVALADAEVFDYLADQTDLDDDELIQLRETLQNYLTKNN